MPADLAMEKTLKKYLKQTKFHLFLQSAPRPTMIIYVEVVQVHTYYVHICM